MIENEGLTSVREHTQARYEGHSGGNESGAEKQKHDNTVTIEERSAPGARVDRTRMNVVVNK